MIRIGRSIRWHNRYEDDVDFSMKNQFDFMQLWFRDGKIVLEITGTDEELIRSKRIIDQAVAYA